MYRKSFEHLYEEGALFKKIVGSSSSSWRSSGRTEETIQEEQPWRNHLRRNKKKPKHKNIHSWGWARTGLEPEVVVYVNDQPLDALLDLGCDASFIDQEISDDLGVKVNPYDCTITHCVGVENLPLYSFLPQFWEC